MNASNSPVQRLVDFFVVPKFGNALKIDLNQAELATKLTLALALWTGLAAMSVGLATGAWDVAGLIAASTASCLGCAFLLRASGKLTLSGVALAVLLGGLWSAAALVTGGVSSFTVGWLVLLPFVGIIFGGYRLAVGATVLAVGLATALHLGAGALAPAQPWIGAAFAGRLRLFEIVSIGFAVLALISARHEFINWLIFSLRQVAAEANAFVSTAPVGLMVVDTEGNAFRFNRAMEETLGCEEPGEMMHMHISEFFEDADALNIEPDADGELPMNDQHVVRRADGTTFPAELAAARLDGDRGTVLVVRDITEQHEYEAELRHARDGALEASRAKSTFLANMSHELRTPLNAVIGYSEMLIEEAEFLQEEVDDTASEAVGQFLPDLSRIRKAGKHLLTLINDILDLSKIEAGKMQFHLETFEISELLEDIDSTIRPLASKNDNQFDLRVGEGLGEMRSDITKLRQILFNLLSNACKFTEQGHVELATETDGDDAVIFSVIDDGIGMSDEQLAKIFEAFTQADESTTRKFGGTGLGLTITHHFCKGLGGDISVESAPGEGTTFQVRLPRQAPEQTEEVEQAASAA